MKRYIDYEEFKNKLINLPNDESIWRLMCEGPDDHYYVFVFSKHLYECDDDKMCPFIIYSTSIASGCGLIQNNIDFGWEQDIKEVWNDITDIWGLKPYIE